MSDIYVEQVHRMEEEELRNHMERLAVKLVNRYGGRYEWDDNKVLYHYDGGVDATVTYTGDKLSVEVKLGFLMKAFKGMVQGELERYLAEEFS